MFNLILVFTLFLLIFSGAEILVRFFHVSPKDTRRLSHIAGGIVAFFLPYLVNFEEVLILGFFFTFFLAFTKKQSLLGSIHKIKRKTWGAFLFPFGLLISAIMFWNVNTQLFQLSALILFLSDGFAGLIGERFGKHSYDITGKKTLEGSITFFVLTFFIFVGLLEVNNLFSLEKVFITFGLSVILTILEGALGSGVDNLVLPITAGLLGSFLI